MRYTLCIVTGCATVSLELSRPSSDSDNRVLCQLSQLNSKRNRRQCSLPGSLADVVRGLRWKAVADRSLDGVNETDEGIFGVRMIALRACNHPSADKLRRLTLRSLHMLGEMRLYQIFLRETGGIGCQPVSSLPGPGLTDPQYIKDVHAFAIIPSALHIALLSHPPAKVELLSTFSYL